MQSHKNMERNQSVFGSYRWMLFSTKSVCRFLFSFVLVCGLLLYSANSQIPDHLQIFWHSLSYSVWYLFCAFLQIAAETYARVLTGMHILGTSDMPCLRYSEFRQETVGVG